MEIRKKRKTITHYQIFDYWKNKYISENGEVLEEDKRDYSRSIAVVNDWGEPECFACCRFLLRDDYYNSEDYAKDIISSEENGLKKIWDARNLYHAEKAHILAHSLGGKDEPSNMFILCPMCHQESPDTTFSTEFFRWVYSRRNEPHGAAREICSAIKELEDEGVDLSVINVDSILDSSIEFMSDMTTHGGVTQPCTVKAWVKGLIRRELAK